MFDIKWTDKELAKIREIKARPPELRDAGKGPNIASSKRLLQMLAEVDGMTPHQVQAYLRERKL